MQISSAVILMWVIATQIANAAGAPTAGKASVISRDSYALCGLSIGDSEDKAREVLGAPKSFHLEPAPVSGERTVTMLWPGIEGSFLDFELVNLKVHSSECGNPDGLLVGASIDRAFALLGKAEAEVLDDGTKRYRYWLEGTDCDFFVATREDKIVELQLWFDYT